MYKNILATQWVSIFYFIFYVLVITLLLNNIFIGLVLAGMDKMSNDMQFANTTNMGQTKNVKQESTVNQLQEKRDGTYLQLHKIKMVN